MLTAENKKTKTRLVYALAIIIAPALYYLVYIGHFLNQENGRIATGFIGGDFPYYSANGREIFENGNGFAYPNPYSKDEPAIYFHLLFYILGVGIKFFGFDPGYQFFILGLVCAVATSTLTFLIVREVLTSQRFLVPLFFLVMWGGSIFVLSSAFANVFLGGALTGKLFVFDPFDGEWGLNWGRSLMFPAEAFYHMLFAGTWLLLLKRQWLYAILGAALLALSTPFTGIQLALIVSVFFGAMGLVERRPLFYVYLVLSLGIIAWLYWYYYIFLKSYDFHLSVHERFTLGEWILPWHSFFIAYIPIGIIATIRLVLDRFKLTYKEWLFLVSFAISAALVKNELFLQNPVQPIHFTRGYVWTPLMLLSLPLIQKFLVKLWEKRNRTYALTMSLLLFTLAILDNIAYVRWHSNEPNFGLSMSIEEREMLQWMDTQNIRGTLLSSNYFLSYLTATYSEVTPYLGYWNLTPDFNTRSNNVLNCVKYGQGGKWLEEIDLIMADRDTFPACVEKSEWTIIHETGQVVLFARQP